MLLTAGMVQGQQKITQAAGVEVIIISPTGDCAVFIKEKRIILCTTARKERFNVWLFM